MTLLDTFRAIIEASPPRLARYYIVYELEDGSRMTGSGWSTLKQARRIIHDDYKLFASCGMTPRLILRVTLK